MRFLRERAWEEQGIQGEEDQELLLPMFGITAVGHMWSLHIASKEKDGTVKLYGPFLMGDTYSGFDVFQILNILGQITSWGRTVYFLAGKEDIVASGGGTCLGS
ncbi:hypothetical protein ACJ73_03992 [Blastomyces percursus]|uniref:PD-(D/E)XK nuclease-like domain-containing protein n=1 Tax=Blastomyces percursus TaxID=1658174 RepID=A0A1J9RAF1_9EURO|nr:hypothetical protein ACJ73_03992 [Blastomyces percursus]